MRAAHPLTGILLAAGQGRRFGADKLLAPLPSGEALALAAARKLRDGLRQAAGDRVRLLAVLRPEQILLAGLLTQAGYDVVLSDEARTGMGRSLAQGVAASREAEGWLVALADMPAILPGTIARVAEALRNGASLAAPFHGGRRGHPVGFSQAWREELLALEGDAGARHLLQNAGPALLRIATDDSGVLMDVDTPMDINALKGNDTRLH
jgi:molybdenum cofactor cytidylyltransferase